MTSLKIVRIYMIALETVQYNSDFSENCRIYYLNIILFQYVLATWLMNLIFF